MKISIDSERIEFVAEGMALLRLKAALYSRVGNLLESTKGKLVIPRSSLSFVEDLLGEEAASNGSIKADLYELNKHAQAREAALKVLEDCEPISDEDWAQVLDPAQATAVNAMILPYLKGLCLFDEQGSGKTVMSIAAFDILKKMGVIDGMIVVCPKTMLSEWPKDLTRFTGTTYKIIKAEGDSSSKYEAVFKDFDVLISNYEGIEAMLVPLTALAKRRKMLLVVDESFYLKNDDSRRSISVMKLRYWCSRCFVLCGTPAPNSAHDLINQFDLADLGYTFSGFNKSRNAVDDIDKISDRIDTRGVYIRRLKTEILEHVPEKNFHVVAVEMAGKQKAMYENARSALELELKSLDNQSFKKKLTTYFQRRAALLQICVSPDALDPTYSDVPAKFDALDKLLEDLFTQGRKVIVWSFYKRSLDELMARYARFKPVLVDGSVPTSKRKVAVSSFQEDPSVMLFVGNPAAAGAGITLHSAYDAVYLSYSNQAAHYLQSLDRIHRRGQTANEVNYYLIYCKNTIEETEIIRLRGKEIQQHTLLGDHISWPNSLDDALNELGKHD